MKKKTIIISGIATVLVIGSVVFCFAVKGDSTQPTEIAQTVTEAVATPTIEIPEEEPEVAEPEEVEVVEETSEEVSPEEVPEVEETTEEEETSEEVSIVEVAETEEEVSEEKGVSTPAVEETEPTQPEQAQPVETKQNVNQISADEASQALINQILADGGSIGIPEGVNISESGNVTSSSAGAGVTLE